MSFQIFLLVRHFTNWTRHNLLTDNTLKKIAQDVLVRCLVIVSDHNVKLARHLRNLVGQCPVTDCYFQHCPAMKHYSFFRKQSSHINILSYIIIYYHHHHLLCHCLVFVTGTKTYSFLDGDCTDSEAAYLLAISEKVLLMVTVFHE